MTSYISVPNTPITDRTGGLMSSMTFSPQRTMQLHQQHMQQHHHQHHHQHAQSMQITGNGFVSGSSSLQASPAHPSASASSASAANNPAASVTVANAASSSASNPVTPAATSGAPSSQLLADLVRKLASFRRGLVHERKEKKLLELSLEEALLQQAHLASLMREQDVQLMTSLELSASLEHALHQHTIEPLASTDIGEKQLTEIFTKPKKQMEEELRRLFKELSTIQQFYHILEKRSLTEKITFESSNLKLSRDLKAVRDQLDRVMKDSRKYKSKLEEVMLDCMELREENTKRKTDAEGMEKDLRAQLDNVRTEKSQQDQRVMDLEAELQEQKRINSVLSTRAFSLSEKVDSLELTLRHFTCTRIRTKEDGGNVSCEISVKKIPLTGELVLEVKDHVGRGGASGISSHVHPHLPFHPNIVDVNGLPQHQPLSNGSITANAATGALTSSSSLAVSPSHGLLDFSQEYSQDISTVRCCAVLEDSPGGAAVDDSTADESLLPASTFASLPSFQHPPVLGFKPRFVLCFSADNHRCMIFETESEEFRRNICDTLQQFVRMIKDKHVDELGAFFGDVRGGGGGTEA